MKTVLHPGLSVGWTPNRFKNERLSACFFVKMGLRLKAGAAAELDKDEPPRASGDRFAEDDPTKPLVYPSDFVPFKPRTDILIRATAHAPGGQPLRSFETRVQIGDWSKSLKVFGPRNWNTGLLGRSGTSAAELFADLPLTYEQAMGGPKSKLNPLGIGVEGDAAPRIEEISQPITGPDSRLAPAGYGPIPAEWEPRSVGRGNYNKRWLKERWPWLPDDFDYGVFNSAPRDQQLEKRLRGDEELRFDNLRAEQPQYRTRLPGHRVRCFVVQPDAFREIKVEIDTLWIDVDTERATMCARGPIEVRTLKLREIDAILAWIEPLAEPPRPIGHYQSLYAEKATTAPEAPVPSAAPVVDPTPELDRELEDSLKQMEAFEAQSAALVDPSAALTSDAAPLTTNEIHAVLASLRDLAPDQRAFFETQIADLAKFQAEFAALEAEFDAEITAAPTVDELCKRAASGESLGGLNLAKYDFSGRSLAGVDFRRSLLSEAKFTGANLQGARFDEADITKGDFSGADLRGCGLNRADLTAAKFEGAKLLDVSAVAATVAGVNLAGADLTGLRAESADFSNANLSAAKAPGGRLASCNFAGAVLEGADFRGADLTRAKLPAVKAAKAIFEKATLDFARTGEKADFTSGDFRGVKATSAVFEGVVLDGADFSKGRLTRSLFGDASLRNANFDRAELCGAMFDDADLSAAKLTNANLLRATFERADLQGASLQGSNGYEAGFWEANMTNANLSGTRLSNTLLES